MLKGVSGSVKRVSLYVLLLSNIVFAQTGYVETSEEIASRMLEFELNKFQSEQIQRWNERWQRFATEWNAYVAAYAKASQEMDIRTPNAYHIESAAKHATMLKAWSDFEGLACNPKQIKRIGGLLRQQPR